MQKSKFRIAGWLAVAGLLGAALAAPAAALAADGQPDDVSSEGQESDCTGGPGGVPIEPGEGQVAWLFVHASVRRPAGAR